MSKFFGYVNDVDSHTKSSQYDLALEKLCVTKCGWIQSRTTVLMGTTINKLWQLCCYGVKRDHYDKLIGIREFSELLALYFFKNSFTNDNGNPAKNFPCTEFSQFCFSLHIGQQYLRHNSHQCFIVCLYFGEFYYFFSAY